MSESNIPAPIRFAIATDLGLHAASTVSGAHLTIHPDPTTQFGVLVAIGLFMHEVGPMIWPLINLLRRKPN